MNPTSIGTYNGRAGGGGAAFDPASPGPIGGTTPNAITGTTITATTSFVTGVSGLAGYITPATLTGPNFLLDTNGLYLRPTGLIYWSPNNPLSGTPDLYASRFAAKQVMFSGDGVGQTTNAGIIAGYSGNSASGMVDNSTAGVLSIGPTNATSILLGKQTTLPAFTVAGLPTGIQGGIAYVTDQLTAAAAKGVAPTGGGAVKCVVFYNGSAWVGI